MYSSLQTYTSIDFFSKQECISLEFPTMNQHKVVHNWEVEEKWHLIF